MAVDPNHKTLKRRALELRKAAQTTTDMDSTALLLFYGAECILKALFLTTFSLKSTSAANAASKVSARSHSHRLDNLLSALQVSPTDCPTRPAVTKLRSGDGLDVGQLHEAWRYGEKIQDHDAVVAWLNKVFEYAEARL